MEKNIVKMLLDHGIKHACCLKMLSLLLAYRGDSTHVTEECLKNFLVSSS